MRAPTKPPQREGKGAGEGRNGTEGDRGGGEGREKGGRGRGEDARERKAERGGAGAGATLTNVTGRKRLQIRMCNNHCSGVSRTRSHF